MAQPYTIRLTPQQVDTLTLSGARSLRDGINQLITAAAAAPQPLVEEPTHPPATSGGHTITITVKID